MWSFSVENSVLTKVSWVGESLCRSQLDLLTMLVKGRTIIERYKSRSDFLH